MRRENEQFLSSGDFASVQAYMDSAGLGYLNGINGTTLESLLRRTEEMGPLKRQLPDPKVIASVGVGQGEELHAIHMLYGGRIEKIIGVDISPLALDAAQNRVNSNNLPVELMLGSATDLPLESQSVDGIVLSSLLHEVYSYSPNGKGAWNRAIRESVRVISEDGCIFIRDSAAPDLREDVLVQVKTNFARQFYPYFTEGYRTFNAWDNLRGRFNSNLPDFPVLGNSDSVVLSVGQAAELLFHFVNFEMGYPHEKGFIEDPEWKELNETYYIPKDPGSPEPMRTDEYVEEIITQGNSILADTEFELVCAEVGHSIRPRMYIPISEHFALGLPGFKISSDKGDELIRKFINKMELVFKKIRRGNN